ncbi:MAG: DUF2975 domain-containing protein [Neisseriales bacterium]|nr:MAG: DUF2975 domain-containing protein [Neisseriales bacterium]
MFFIKVKPMYAKLATISKRVQLILKIIFILLLFFISYSWLFPQSSFSHAVLGPSLGGYATESQIDQFQLNNQLIGFTGSFLGLLPLFIGLRWLIKLFTNYARGEIFTVINVKSYSRLGYLCLLSALLFQPLSQMILAIAVSINYPKGHRFIAFSFDNTNLTAIIVGICLIVIAYVMQIGHELQEEQKLTV